MRQELEEITELLFPSEYESVCLFNAHLSWLRWGWWLHATAFSGCSERRLLSSQCVVLFRWLLSLPSTGSGAGPSVVAAPGL